ncbi:unnamed protein product [Heligmosomoides polygyrus]|uniref:H15 domain-containing protein n=1 Tax=Heligmosomoides polygyrus TaxID=6339 RepID=A0A183FWK7_HELPZ|nr:unnamed protein product [Heligmosomoides polygyrus]
MADQLNKIPISSAIVWVWPEWMPKQEHMGVCLQTIERHLQCGGTLDCFPAPLKKAREEHWDQKRLVCLEVIQMLIGPKRGFDARVIDHYGSLAESILKFHPALSLGVSPRKGDGRLHGWQVHVFLEQLREAASNTLRLPNFKLKPRKPKDVKNNDAKPAHATKDAEPAAKKKPPKRPSVMYVRDSKKKREEQASNMKQKGRGPYKSHQELTR